MNYSFLSFCCGSVIAGLCLGASAPGVGLWITAWFSLSPLLFIINLERSWAKVLVYGFLFGLAYNCVYWQWLLNLTPLDWLGFNSQQGLLMSWTALLFVSARQAVLIALFALIYHFIFSNRLITSSKLNNWLHLLLVPLLWILIYNKIGNARCICGVPWSMLEYTQCKNLWLLQIADIIGGTGISFLLVMINSLIERIAMRFYIESWKDSARSEWRTQYLNILKPLLPQAVCTITILTTVIGYGLHSLSTPQPPPASPVTVVQPNVNIEMYKSEKKYSLAELLALGIALSEKSAPGLCIWTESALPVRLNHCADILKQLKDLSIRQKLSLLIGVIGEDTEDNIYNSIVGISSTGEMSDFYHKRYLVPFGEYTPSFVDYLPYSQTIRTLTNTPAGAGYSCGEKASPIKVDNALIAPLVCFDVIAPELASASVKAGGQLLVNIDDLSWFHKSIIGDQIIACAIMRAIENRRYCIVAANTGPSVIISSKGEILNHKEQNIAGLLAGKIRYANNLSFYTSWFGF